MRFDPLLTKPVAAFFGRQAEGGDLREPAQRTAPSQLAGSRLHMLSRFVLPERGMPACFFGDISGRPAPTSATSLTVEPGLTYSSESYFNSFFLGHLRSLTDFQEVTLDLELSGEGQLRILGKTGTKEHILATTTFAGNGKGLAFRIAADDIANSDYLFFRLEAGETPVTLRSARWAVVSDNERPVKLTIGICTYNRDQYLLPNLQWLLADKALMDGIHSLIVVDQGEHDYADWSRRASLSHPKLHWRHQRNLGGSGGFSRAMFEAKQNGSTHILLLDDDATYHPESVWRLLQLLKFPGPPRIWGAPMFSLSSPSKTYEVSGVYQPVLNRVQSVGYGIDIDGGKGLNKILKATESNGYSAWFFCCFDVQPGCEEGGALPFFLHYDDVELSYRFRALGYEHKIIPGLAIWHEALKNRPPWRILLKVRNKFILSTMRHVKSGIPGAIYGWTAYYLIRAAIKGGPGRLDAVLSGMESFAKGPAAMFEVFDEVSSYRRQPPRDAFASVPRFLLRTLLAFRGAQQARREWEEFDSATLTHWRRWQTEWSAPDKTKAFERTSFANS